MNAVAHSVELKLARALAQIRALEEAVAVWVNANPLIATCELREGRLGFASPSKSSCNPLRLITGDCSLASVSTISAARWTTWPLRWLAYTAIRQTDHYESRFRSTRIKRSSRGMEEAT